MSSDDLVWVGAAPLDSEDMNRLRRDLILQRTLLWVPTGFVIAIILLFLFKLPLSAPESILTLVFTFFIGLGFGRMSGNQRFNQIKDALILVYFEYGKCNRSTHVRFKPQKKH